MSSSSTHQSLQWTRPLIDELGQEILQAVERWSERGTDRNPADLDGAVEACRRIAGSLSVLEFESGDLLGQAMADALEALRKDDFGREEEALNALMEATATLPDYLDYLESTQRDAPLVLLPTINNLRTAIGAKPLDEAEFFKPAVDHVELPEGEETASAGELRRTYQQALGGFLVDNGNQESLDALTQIGVSMRDAPDLPASARRTGWAAAAVSASLAAGDLQGGPAVARLYARLDALLKRLAEDGADIDEAADALCRAFLFNLAINRPDNKIATQAWAAFRLDEHAPEAAGQARAFLAGKNRGLFAAVTQAAREDLAQIKDTLGSQLERSADPDLLEKQTELLGSVGESLAMLGLDNLAERIRDQASRLSEIGSDPEDPALLAVARELLVVESQLEENIGTIEAESGQEDEDVTGTLLPPSEWRRVLRQVFHEAGEDLSHAKSLLDALNRGKAEPDAAREARDMLDRIAHVLHMADLEDGAAMLQAATRLIETRLINGDEAPESELETLAEALTVSEFYFDAQTRLDEQGRNYFASTRERLRGLGYWPADEGEAFADSESIEDQTPPEGAEETSHETGFDEPTFGEEETTEPPVSSSRRISSSMAISTSPRTWPRIRSQAASPSRRSRTRKRRSRKTARACRGINRGCCRNRTGCRQALRAILRRRLRHGRLRHCRDLPRRVRPGTRHAQGIAAQVARRAG